MKGSQVGLVLIALIALGIAGLVVRAVSAGAEDTVLSGLLPISPDVVDGVTIRTTEREIKLRKLNDVWRVGEYQAFEPKLAQMWQVVDKFDGAQLIATNPANHARMGVDPEHGTEIIFFLGGAVQERFIIGSWSPSVRLCYLKRPTRDEVYALGCPSPDLFEPDVDGWRNPIVLSVPREAVETLTFRYPEDEFEVSVTGPTPLFESEELQAPANPFLVEFLLRSVEILVASGFASDEEAEQVDFDFPDASLRVGTKEGSQLPTSRLLFVKREDGDYYVRNTALASVFIVDGQLVEALLRPREEFLGAVGG